MHKPYILPEDSMYLPIQVGRAGSHIDLKIQSDNMLNGKECDNISSLNSIYCEMTAMYWAWKNIRKIYPDIKYVGLCHYRRYFDANKHKFSNGVLQVRHMAKAVARIITGKNALEMYNPMRYIDDFESDQFKRSNIELKEAIYHSDIVTTRPVKVINGTVRMIFESVGRSYISLLEKLIKSDYSEYYDMLEKILNGSLLNAANMIIIRAEYLDDYCSFIFDVLGKHLAWVKEDGICYLPEREKCYSRVSGYLAELLTCAYIQNHDDMRIQYTNKFYIDLK